MIYQFCLTEWRFKVSKAVIKWYDKTEYVIHTRNLKAALNHGLVLKNKHRIIKFKQKTWSKSYADINKKAKMIWEETFYVDEFKPFGKTMKNVTKFRDIQHHNSNFKKII